MLRDDVGHSGRVPTLHEEDPAGAVSGRDGRCDAVGRAAGAGCAAHHSKGKMGRKLSIAKIPSACIFIAFQSGTSPAIGTGLKR